MSSSARHHVVIIGSGFGGLSAAKTLGNKDVDVTLIAKTTHHLFQPLLYQVATGILSEGEIAPMNRVILKDYKNIKILQSDVTHIDVEKKCCHAKYEDTAVAVNYDSLIVATGATQSYFGNEHFSEFAPGLKSLDDALELRSRIISALEFAEVEEDPEKRKKLLRFTIVGAGATGVELAGQIAELIAHTLSGTYKNFSPEDAEIYLLDGAPLVLPPYGEKLGGKAQKRLEKLGVKVILNALVTSVTANTVTYKLKNGEEHTIESECKIWSAGVAASPLGKNIADQTKTDVDRSGRVKVEPDLTVKGHPEIFVVGDLMSVPDVPGVCQGAIQGAKYAAKTILAELNGRDQSARKPFKYFNKGSMATVARHHAVLQMGKIEFAGYFAWLGWLLIHVFYLVGFNNRMMTIMRWFVTFTTHRRAQLSSTTQQRDARQALKR